MSLSPAEGLGVLREEAGLHAPLDRALLRVRGQDAADYLQRMTSQDLLDLPVGDARRTCVLDSEGRLVGAPWVWRLEEGYVLELSQGAAASVRARLERMVVTDDVGIDEAYGRLFLVAGPRSRSLTEGVASSEVLRIARRDLGEVPGYAWLVLASGPDEKVVLAASSAGLIEVGAEAFDALRVLTRTPACGAELDDRILPLEARLEAEAISFSKGCYPGQEPVTMAVYRGHPPTLLVRGRAEGAAAGRALLRDGRAVGRVTTTTRLTRDDEPNALAFVKHALASEGPTLDVEGGGTFRVLDGEGPA